MADRTFHDNIDALHGDAASRRGIAVDHEKAAASCRPGGLRNVTLHVHLSGHHVFRNAGPGISVDHDGRALVDRKSTRLNSSHSSISYAVFCLKKKKNKKVSAKLKQKKINTIQ